MKGQAKNWKTTVGGFLIAAGTALQASEDSTVKITGIIIGALGGLLLGATAKDSDVTGGKRQQ